MAGRTVAGENQAGKDPEAEATAGEATAEQAAAVARAPGPRRAKESWATSPGTRRSMQSNRSRDTRPELALRRALHALGLRYRVCARPLPGVRSTADIVFRPARVAVEVRGCFWHGCPEHYRAPSANAGYWAEKVERNRRRDAENDRRLREAGWALEVVWEHEDPARASERVASLVRSRRPPPAPERAAAAEHRAGAGPAGPALTRRQAAARRTRPR